MFTNWEVVKSLMLSAAIAVNTAWAEGTTPSRDAFPTSCAEWLTNEKAVSMSAMFGRIPTHLKDKIIGSAYEMATELPHVTKVPQFTLTDRGAAAIAQLHLLGESHDKIKERLLPLLHETYRVRVAANLDTMRWQRLEQWKRENPLGESHLTDSLAQSPLAQAIRRGSLASSSANPSKLEIKANVVKTFFDGAILLQDMRLAELFSEYLLYLDKSSDEAIQSLVDLDKQEELFSLGQTLVMDAFSPGFVGTEIVQRIRAGLSALSFLKKPELKQRALPLILKIVECCETSQMEEFISQWGDDEDESEFKTTWAYEVGVEAIILARQFGYAKKMVDLSLVRFAKRTLELKYILHPHNFEPLIHVLKETQNQETLLRMGENIDQSLGNETMLEDMDSYPLAYFLAIDCFLAADKKTEAKGMVRRLVRDFPFHGNEMSDGSSFVIINVFLDDLLERVARLDDPKLTAEIDAAIESSGATAFPWSTDSENSSGNATIAQKALDEAFRLTEESFSSSGDEVDNLEAEADRTMQRLVASRFSIPNENNEDKSLRTLALKAHRYYLQAAWACIPR